MKKFRGSVGWDLADAVKRTSVLAASSGSIAEIGAAQASHAGGCIPPTLKTGADALEAELFAHFSSGKLVVTGTRKPDGTERYLVSPDSLRDFVTADWLNSTLRHRNRSGEGIWDVRVFSVLNSPQAAGSCDTLTLSVAFREHILRDPEVVARSQFLGPGLAQFNNGFCPGPFPCQQWPLDENEVEFASRFERALHIHLSRNLPKASSAQLELAMVLVDRLQGFRSLLAAGDLIAHGENALTGGSAPVDCAQWKKHGLFIDLGNDELCEEKDQKTTVCWSGVHLRANGATRRTAPISQAITGHIDQDLIPETALRLKPDGYRWSPEMESIKIAVTALWEGKIPPGLAPGKRITAVLRWLASAENVTVPSERTVRRYFERS